MLIVVFILADVTFFSVVFIYMDRVIVNVTEKHDLSKVMPWLVCLFQNGKATEQCFELGQKVLPNQATVFAILFLLGVSLFCILDTWLIELTTLSLPEHKFSSS